MRYRRMGLFSCDYVTTGTTSKREMTALFELVPTWLKNTVFVKERSLDFPLKQLGS